MRASDLRHRPFTDQAGVAPICGNRQRPFGDVANGAVAWCEVHHVVEWQHGGATAIANLVVLCRACHRLVHHGGWTVALHGARAVFTPPAWIDPERRPRRGPPRLVDLDDLLTAVR